MAAEIINSIVPSTLYRYRSLQHLNREIEAIEKSTIFSSEYSMLNDPMEGAFESSRLLKKDSKKVEQVKRTIDAHISKVGICSFCEVRDHELMWAHYADQFRGICIAFNFSKLRSKLPDENTFVRVSYSEKPLAVGTVKRTPQELVRRVLSQKNHRWLYEREWRMFGPKGIISYRSVDVVRTVYLGFRVAVEDKQKIEARLSKANITVRLMKLDNYAISF